MVETIQDGLFIGDGASRYTMTMAMPSDHVFETGKVHSITMSSDNHALDSKAEIYINKDSERMLEARADMQKAVEPYAYLEETDFERYEALVARDAIKIKEEHFGKYDTEHGNGLRNLLGAFSYDDTVKIEEMGKDEMVCSHMSSVVCVLMHDVGVRTHLMSSPMYVEGDNKEDIEGHQYVVSARTGNIIEATTRAEHAERAYKETVGGGPATWSRILEGEIALTYGGDAYGAGIESGKLNRSKMLDAAEKARIEFSDIVYGGATPTSQWYNDDYLNGPEEARVAQEHSLNEELRSLGSKIGGNGGQHIENGTSVSPGSESGASVEQASPYK